MAQSDLLKALLAGKVPQNLRSMIARGLAPVPPAEMLELLVCLLKDSESGIASQAAQSIASWDEEEILAQLKNRNCAPAVLEHFAVAGSPDHILQAIIANPSSPGTLVGSLALTVPVHLLEMILDNRVRLIEFPDILENVKRNPCATPEIQRLVQEIEVEFLGDKRKEYAIEEPSESTLSELRSLELESGVPPEDLSLEGLPLEGEDREAEVIKRLSAMPVREKIRHALFGTREIRAILVRDSNKEIALTVLHSPKLTDNEIETIAAMRSVREDILREIGGSKEWTRNYVTVQNLVKNPKTPPLVSQRLLPRLRSQELTQLTRDRSIPEAVRHNATRVLKQRNSTRSIQ
jgi:hypothetical protein